MNVNILMHMFFINVFIVSNVFCILLSRILYGSFVSFRIKFFYSLAYQKRGQCKVSNVLNGCRSFSITHRFTSWMLRDQKSQRSVIIEIQWSRIGRPETGRPLMDRILQISGFENLRWMMLYSFRRFIIYGDYEVCCYL